MPINAFKIFDPLKERLSLEFGNKANGLLFLKKHKFQVPFFYILPFETLKKCRNKELSLDDLCNNWVREFGISEDSLWAVRSSTNAEDSDNESFAGLFESKTNCSVYQLPQAITEVLNSYNPERFTGYKIPENFKYGIIIQQMIQPDYAGVIFSHHPTDHKKEGVYINIIPGLGENLVSGKETAMELIFHNGKAEYINPGEEYRGEVFANGLKTIVKTRSEIQEEIDSSIKKLSKGAQKLSRLKKQPVDIEFAIKGNEIYWLQVRPATYSNTDTSIWDNGNIGDNYPGTTLPLTISYVRYTYLNAYSAMAGFLGMTRAQIDQNRLLFENMVGGINGALYYNVTAWQQLLYQLPFGKITGRIITRLWGMDDAEFTKPQVKIRGLNFIKLFIQLLIALLLFKKHKRKFENTYQATLHNFNNPVKWPEFDNNKDLRTKSQFNGKNHHELAQLVRDLNNSLGSNWIVPVLNGFYAMIFFSLLKRIIAKSKLNKTYPNFANDILYSQGDVISVQMVHDFQNLIMEITQKGHHKALFKDENEREIIAQLKKEYPGLNKKILNYIMLYGERCRSSELKIETINYKENPLSFISFLKTNLKTANKTKGKTHSFNYKKIIRDHYRFNWFKRIMILGLIRLTIRHIKDRENYRFYRTQAFHIVRKIFGAMDEELFRIGMISHLNDSLYLEFNEILDFESAEHIQSLITKRKKEYALFRKMQHANRYHLNRGKFTAVMPGAASKPGEFIKGTGCCSGLVTEKVILVDENNYNTLENPSLILIAKNFEPGWVNLFAQASGVISERGNLLGHTAILFREMGIPSIVGAKGILDKIKNGDLIQMNGSTGEIKILNHE